MKNAINSKKCGECKEDYGRKIKPDGSLQSLGDFLKSKFCGDTCKWAALAKRNRQLADDKARALVERKEIFENMQYRFLYITPPGNYHADA